jgi:raffinose synthase
MSTSFVIETRVHAIHRDATIVRFDAEEPVNEAVLRFPIQPGWDRWLACWRRDACWITPSVGESLEDIPEETQMLMLRRGGRHQLLMPLVRDGFRASIRPINASEIGLRVESGSGEVRNGEFPHLYIIEGENPYELSRIAAGDSRRLADDAPFREEPRRPEFIRGYGWCSWNAFYLGVTADGIRSVMENYDRMGLCPRFVIIDGGWQDANDLYIKGLGSDKAKFPDGIKALSEELKSRLAVEYLFLWQTFIGFWCGLFPEHFKDASIARMHPPKRFLPSGHARGRSPNAPNDTVSERFYPTNILHCEYGLPKDFKEFYREYHRRMAKDGADGVKIDAISWIETLGSDRGGRVAVMREFLRAAEASGGRYFDGKVIWCSSSSNDFLQLSRGDGLVRTSVDYFPDKPETHGRHVYANAINSLFMGAYLWPDWDMFQSGLGQASVFHAASRAISGGPVYTADAAGKEDFDLLRKLVLPDGGIPLCDSYALPCADSLYADPKESLIKVFNRNTRSAVVAVFNCHYGEGGRLRLHGQYRVRDVEDFKPSRGPLIWHRHSDGRLWLAAHDETFSISLDPLEFEILTITAMRGGFAPIGDPSLFNPGGVIRQWEHRGRTHDVAVLCSRGFLAYCETPPVTVLADGRPIRFEWNKPRLTIDFKNEPPGTISVQLP